VQYYGVFLKQRNFFVAAAGYQGLSPAGLTSAKMLIFLQKQPLLKAQFDQCRQSVAIFAVLNYSVCSIKE